MSCENWYWKCPKCGKINCAKEDYEAEYSTEFITECENPKCRYEVTAYVEYTQPEFEFYAKDGEDIESLDEFDVEDMEEDEERICPKCGNTMVLCEDEKTCYQIWECDECGYKEDD